MLGDPTSYLTDGQKACLRLVAQGMSSKEIARELQLTPLTVDTYVKAAIARLGVANRREAARRLHEQEISQKSGSPSQTLVSQPPSIKKTPQTQPGGQQRAGAAEEFDAVVEADIGDGDVNPEPGTSSEPSIWSLRLPPIGGRRHDLNISQTLAQIAKVAVAAALVTSAIVTLTEGVMRLLSN